MRIALLISGGVDSSIALHHLHMRGHDITAYFLKVWSEDDTHFIGGCPWDDDLHYARLVCAQYGVPLQVLPLQREYREAVISYMISELRTGGTPSPDIFCNSMIKFGIFWDMVAHTCDFVASGHYARLIHRRHISCLACARDVHKDQTYFLSHLSQNQLQKIRMPLGAYTKRDIRTLARKIKLPNAGRPDSQGLCFLGTVRYHDFIAHYLSRTPGNIVHSESGAVLGAHQGFWFYTIGQRQGLGLGGGPWYVVGKNCTDNTIMVSSTQAALACSAFTVEEVVINNPSYARVLHDGKVLACRIKIRHTPYSTRCTMHSIGNDRYHIHARHPFYAVASGQRIAIYVRRYCIGGGRIIS